jgi:hypothetical protein
MIVQGSNTGEVAELMDRDKVRIVHYCKVPVIPVPVYEYR